MRRRTRVPYKTDVRPIEEVKRLNANKKSSSELSLQRMTLDEIEEIRISAQKNGNQEMLAWSLLMEEVLHIRDLLEERRDEMISIIQDMPVTEVDRAQLADTIRSALLGTYPAENQRQQPDSTEHRQKQDEEPHLQKPET